MMPVLSVASDLNDTIHAELLEIFYYFENYFRKQGSTYSWSPTGLEECWPWQVKVSPESSGENHEWIQWVENEGRKFEKLAVGQGIWLETR